MDNDIEKIIQRFSSLCPDMQVQQLKVTHPGIDDDGLWFFTRKGSRIEVQLESSSGNCPFLIESNVHEHRFRVSTIEEAVQILQSELRCE